MDSNKNMLEAWADAQTKSVNNLVETSKKVQESFQKGHLLEETTDIYKNWLNHQQEIVAETISTNTDAANGKEASASTENTTNAMNDMFGTWMNAQAQFTKTFMEGFSKMMPSQQANKSFSPMEMFNEASKMYQQWNSLFSNVINHTNGQVNGASNLFNGIGNMNNSFSQMLNSANVYNKMFEMWQPIATQMQKNMEAMQANGSKAADMMQMFSPEKYREVMNSVFNFAPAGQFKQMYEQMTSFTHRFQEQQHEMQHQMMEQAKQMGNIFPESASAFGSNMLNNPYVRQMEQAFAPLTRLMPHGKEKEALETFKQLKDKFTTYWGKYNDMQYIIYTTAQHSMEKVMENALEKAKENKGQMIDFKEFYNQWMNTTENLMIETFGSDDFSKVQGELLTVGAEIKGIMEKQMERSLEGLPLVPRTEADEMAQTIHDLKARVRSLEKQLRNNAKQEAEEAEAAEKTTKKAVAKK